MRVTPRAARESIEGFDAQGRLRVRLTAPPVEGAANEALVKLLSRHLGVARRAVSIRQGAGSRDKVVEVEGCDEADLRRLLGGKEKER